jgi:tRNA(Arg) A34 adenosine deaminase TadA
MNTLETTPAASSIAERDRSFLRRAVALARERMLAGAGGPFGAVVVRDGAVIAEGTNLVTSTNDPTAHAEVVAIRQAAAGLGRFSLEGCVLYSSCEPCPMCLGAVYWARLDRLVFASTRHDAQNGGFDDASIYHELVLPHDRRRLPTDHLPLPEADALLREWLTFPARVPY